MLQVLLRVSPRHARRPLKALPVLACIPGGHVWFLRLSLAFLSHLERGGHVADRLTGRIVGDPDGPAFNFDHLRGGPLLWVPGWARGDHLFIGHTVCPGFNRISSQYSWWAETAFCASGFDYLHDGLDYAHVPVDMAPHAFVPLAVPEVDAAAWRSGRQPVVLVHGDPVAQAATFFAYCRDHGKPAYSRLDDRPLADWSFRDYLFRHALPSYAKLFISYQAMAKARPNDVRICGGQAMEARPVETLGGILAHLTGRQPSAAQLEQALGLARRDHLAAIEQELGRRLDGSRIRRRNVRVVRAPVSEAEDPDLRREALAFLGELGVDVDHFEATADPRPPRIAAAGGGRA